jgi:integrase
VGYAGDGRRRRRTLFGNTKKEVQEQLAGVQMTLLEGTFVEPSKLRVADFLDRWLEDAAKPTIRATTHASYQGILQNHIQPKIGGITLSRLTPIHVQAMYASLEREGASPRLRQLVHAVLRRALQQALKWDLVYRNACDAVDPPRVPKRDPAALSSDQVAALLAAAKGHRLEALLMVAVGTGMRLGEIFALQWQNVDLVRAAIHVRQTLTEIGGTLTLNEPKTPKSRRRIDLPKSVVAALEAHRQRMREEGFGEEEASWVFTNTTGGPLRRGRFQTNVFKPLLKAAGLPDIRFHDLRHTSASLLLAAGVHPKIVQERLGHSQIGTTLDIYSHALPTMGLDAAARLDTMMSPPNTASR